MVITDFLERNSRLYGQDTALVVVSPSEKRDQAVTWREASLIESATDSPYRREMNWRTFDQMANRFANLLLSRETPRGTKVGILMMNCLEYLPIYFGVLKAGCIVVPMNYRYSSDEIKYCLELADVEILVFGPEFVARMDAIADDIQREKTNWAAMITSEEVESALRRHGLHMENPRGERIVDLSRRRVGGNAGAPNRELVSNR